MASQGIQLMGMIMALLGWLLVLVVCALPMWRVTAFIGANIVTAQNIWEGMWMNCVVQSTGQMQCKVYDSMLALPQDLQAARAMIIISIITGIFGIFLSIAGGKCTNCIEEESSKAKACIASGVLYIVSGALCLIPVSWSANTIIRDFYNPMLIEAQRRELGPLVMGRIGKEVSGQVLSIIGFVGVCVTCGIPMWRVTTYIGANIVTGQIIWDGLWMNCVMQSTGQMQCKMNESVMRLTQDLQSARALVIISVLFCFIGLAVTFIGAKCTSCLDKDSSKAKVMILGGILLIIGGVLVLIPVCWSAATTITDFSNPLTIETQRRELGASIYIGWGSAALLFFGGIILCTSCPPQQPMYGYGPTYAQAPMYPYAGPMMNPGNYGKVYGPPPTYSVAPSYMPSKQYAASGPYSAGRYL
ncbi:claudin-5-like [Osmerus mordax]|uniref:claudin-5-like n=1 Tax=Osmerus mordax TaxID=8014 RepID=UPI00350FB5D3